MMNLDVFAALQNPSPFAFKVELHNVRLMDVVPGSNQYETLMVEYQGGTRKIAGGSRWTEFSGREVGKVGYLVQASPSIHDDMPAGACYFRAYIDQSLRRVPELDDLNPDRDPHGRVVETIGWQCEARPDGFRAPPGLIPGESGNFVTDQTEAVTVRVPPEFARECLSVQRSVEAILQGFMADAAGIMNYIVRPRADGYSSNGSDERMYATNWLDRAYGMDRVNLDVLDAAAEERADQELQREDMAGFLDDFVSYGGKADDLLKAVAALVDRQKEAE